MSLWNEYAGSNETYSNTRMMQERIVELEVKLAATQQRLAECEAERARVRVLRGIIVRLAGAASRVAMHPRSDLIDEMNGVLFHPEIIEIMAALRPTAAWTAEPGGVRQDKPRATTSRR